MAERHALTLKYRPQTFEELLVQEHVRDTLRRAVERNRLANAYLFAGPRGVGKTTSARILAKCLNCLSADAPTVTPCNKCAACIEITESRSLDVMEIDGASSRGIDQIRELRENIRYTPSSLRTKVYIIDEVHMLTKEAFNAILKTLEEPPAHARFIFATTEAQRLPLTIVSRCQRFDFRKATVAEIATRIRWLAERESITISPQAITALAVRADGAIRDAESMLEQSAMYCRGTVELTDLEELFGIAPAEMFFEYADLLVSGNEAALLGFVDRVFERGYDFLEFYAGLVGHFRALLLRQFERDQPGLPPDEQERLGRQAARFDRGALLQTLDRLSRAEDQTRRSSMPRLLFEVISLELAAIASLHGTTPATTNPMAAPERSPLDIHALWQEFRLRVNEQRPMLASLLDLALPQSLTGGALTITLPIKHRAAVDKIEAARDLLDRILSDVTGTGSRLSVSVSRSSPRTDPAVDGLRQTFGDIEEQTR